MTPTIKSTEGRYEDSSGVERKRDTQHTIEVRSFIRDFAVDNKFLLLNVYRIRKLRSPVTREKISTR